MGVEERKRPWVAAASFSQRDLSPLSPLPLLIEQKPALPHLFPILFHQPPLSLAFSLLLCSQLWTLSYGLSALPPTHRPFNTESGSPKEFAGAHKGSLFN